MTRHDRPGLGDIVQALSLKVTDMQRELGELRRDIRTLTHLVRQMQPAGEEPSETKQHVSEGGEH